MQDSAVSVARAFVAAINAADLGTLRALMSEDHTFTDAKGHAFSGAETMIQGWRHFFHAYPEYWIRIEQSIADGNRVALFGAAGGQWRVDEHTVTGTWHVPAAWLAEIESGKVKRWSVFCDTTWATPPKGGGA